MWCADAAGSSSPWILPIDIHPCDDQLLLIRMAADNAPSALVSSTITLTFLAKSFRLSSDLAASENPFVSPHPPIATITAVPLANFGRTSSTVVKSGQTDGGAALLKIAERMNASATCVTCETKKVSGTTLCWLEL